MDKIVLVICLLTIIPAGILSNRLRSKYKNTKGLLIAQFVWLLLCTIGFVIFLRPVYTTMQNIVAGAFISVAMVYFFFKLRNFRANSH